MEKLPAKPWQEGMRRCFLLLSALAHRDSSVNVERLHRNVDWLRPDLDWERGERQQPGWLGLGCTIGKSINVESPVVKDQRSTAVAVVKLTHHNTAARVADAVRRIDGDGGTRRMGTPRLKPAQAPSPRWNTDIQGRCRSPKMHVVMSVLE